MKILIITNHASHSVYDSIFAIAEALHRPEQGHSVFLSSMATSPAHFAREEEQFLYREYNPLFNFEQRNAFFDADHLQIGNVDDFDLVFFRLDRIIGQPDAIFQYFNYIGDISNKVKFVNSPAGLSLTKSKQYLLNFDDICPKFVIANRIEDALAAFSNSAFVLKPLDGYGGKGIIRVDEKRRVYLTDEKLSEVESKKYIENLPSSYFPILAMEYLKHVSKGDKRTVVVAGQCLGSVLRVPQQGSWLANLAQGATTEAAEPDSDELDIVKRIDPILRENGILVYGIDTLVDNNGSRKLSEINTANVGGFLQIQETSGSPVLKKMADLIIGSL